MKGRLISLIVLFLFSSACRQVYDEGSFGHDKELLEIVDDLVIIEHGGTMIAVSPGFQGRVFTSTSGGMDGRSLGYFNRELIRQGKVQSKLSALGGEGRMWFGPEIGKYSIFFEPGVEQKAENIVISPDLDKVLFDLIERTETSVTSGGSMNIRNANAYIFQLYAKRKISLKTPGEIEEELGIHLESQVSTVAFSTNTWISNAGDRQWKKETGLLSIWDLGCMLPSPNTTVIIPARADIDSVTNYFTPIDSTRLRIRDNFIYYKADARYMNKIGIQPEYCRDVFGSYSPELGLLTIVKYSFERDSLYVNSVWGHTSPYKGDVINIFNGEVNESLDRAWPFYEFESSSSAKELKPGEEMTHMQSIYHFEGDPASLNKIARTVLGVDLEDIPLID